MVQGSELDAAAAAAVSTHAACVRGGLAAVLGGRVGAAQRQEALELAAALARAAGTEWILAAAQVRGGLCTCKCQSIVSEHAAISQKASSLPKILNFRILNADP